MPRKGRKGSFEWFEEQVDVEPPNQSQTMVTQELAATQKLQAGGDNVRKPHGTVMHLALGTFLTPRLAPRGCSSQKGSVVTDHTTSV
jgi:hypothetical protein